MLYLHGGVVIILVIRAVVVIIKAHCRAEGLGGPFRGWPTVCIVNAAGGFSSCGCQQNRLARPEPWHVNAGGLLLPGC